MLNAIKSINKGLLVVIVAIICIPIFILIFLAIIQSCNSHVTYDKYEDRMISAAKKYINKNNIEIESSTTILLSELIEEGYIKSTEKLLSDSSCEGKVIVSKNGKSSKLETTGELNYISVLTCDNYKSNSLVSALMDDLTTSESGLYVDGDYYVYKGDKVKNYINFYGSDYRIVSIDKNGIVKLVQSETENATISWDRKYNSELDSSSGKSIYKDSAILDSLYTYYSNKKKISSDAKKHIVSYDVCVGKRNSNDYSISRDLDCSEILEDQVISLLNVSDFARASLDSECNSIISKSCKNYNYLYKVVLNSWTTNSVTDNTYHVYYITNGIAYVQNASEHASYNVVIYINGNEKYESGHGTFNDPYIVK